MTRAIAGLYAIIDPQFLPARWTVAHYARALLAGGCDIVQLRVKANDPAAREQRHRWARALVALKSEYDFCCIINDDAECARDVGADGVHIGQDDGTIARIRTVVGSQRLIGYSSHALEEAQQAAAAGADYVALGAIFPTATKGPGHPVQGCEQLRAVVHAVSCPLVAIGGITRANVAAVWATGVSSVAMITGLSFADDPTAEVRWHRQQWHQSTQPQRKVI